MTPPAAEGQYVYIVQCADNTLYTGWTTNLPRRLQAHNTAHGAKYTKPRRPVTLVYYESCDSKSQALQREAEIKQLTRQEKLCLIQTDLPSASKNQN